MSSTTILWQWQNSRNPPLLGSNSSSSNNNGRRMCSSKLVSFVLLKKKMIKIIFITTMLCLFALQEPVAAATVSVAENNLNRNHNNKDHDAADEQNRQQQHKQEEEKFLEVGEHLKYREPLEEHYAPNIVQQLKQRRTFWANPYDESNWFVSLASEHYALVLEGLNLDHTGAGAAASSIATADVIAADAAEEDNLTFAISALHMAYGALERYLAEINGIREDYPSETNSFNHMIENHRAVIKYQQAEVYLFLAENVRLSPLEQHGTSAYVEYLTLSERLFRQAMGLDDDNDSDNDNNETSTTLEEAMQHALELSWADCCGRLGMALSEGIAGTLPSSTNSSSTKQQQQQLQRAKTYFITAARLYETAGDREEEKKKKQGYHEENGYNFDIPQQQLPPELMLQFHRRQQAVSLQNVAQVAALQGDVATHAAYGERAMEVSEFLLQQQEQNNQDEEEEEDFRAAVLELAHTLSDSHLQLAHYQQAMERYQQAMDGYDEHRESIAPPDIVVTSSTLGTENNSESQELIRTYEQALEDYHNLVLDSNAVVGGNSAEDSNKNKEAYGYVGANSNSDNEMVVQNDGYEGDLHATLGALYVAEGELVLAASHIERAIQLYEQSGEHNERNMGDVKYNAALLWFRKGEYQKSAVYYRESLEIFRETVSEGESPLHKFGLGVPEMEEFTMSVQQQQQQGNGGSGTENNDETVTANTIPVPSKIMNLNAYRQGFLNSTKVSQREEL